MAKAVRNFHLPLPESLYRRLRDAADRAHQPATTVARYAIESWLRGQRKAMLREQIAAYAVAVAGSPDDLDEELESASLVAWRDERPATTERRRKR